MKSTKAQRCAQGHECTLLIPDTCNGDSSTTILAHTGRHGSAKRNHDEDAVYACSACHDAIDRRNNRFWSHDPELNRKLREDREHFIDLAMKRMKGSI